MRHPSLPKFRDRRFSDEAKFTLWQGAVVNTAFFLSGKSVEYILGVLNSKLARWYFGFVGTSSGVGTLRWLKYTIETLPVVHPGHREECVVSDLVRERMAGRRCNVDAEIDEQVCAIYGLTAEEKRTVLQTG